MPFSNRKQAGHELGQALLAHHPDWLGANDVIIAALPRGGLPVAAEVAGVLELPIRLLCVRKIGAPQNEELAVGAIADRNAVWWNEPLIESLQLTQKDLASTLKRERKELERRIRVLSPSSNLDALKSKTVVIVDDGVATGATLRAALICARDAGASKIEIATPVASRGTLDLILTEYSHPPFSQGALHRRPFIGSLALETPDDFSSVGEWYEDFPQLNDTEVLSILQEAPGIRTLHGFIPLAPPQGGELRYQLQWPEQPEALVVFAHGSLSSAASPRNNQVALQFRSAGYATFLFDLLTEEEFAHRAHVFDIPYLTERLILGAENAFREILARTHSKKSIPIVLFGASTGAAAAINAAAKLRIPPLAVLSRGGRPDLADPSALKTGTTPTLLLVGALDRDVIPLNEDAFEKMKAHRPCELHLVTGATHLFEEPGAMDEVAQQCIQFILKSLKGLGVKAA